MHCFFVCFLVVIDEDEPVVNQSIVQEVVEASQRSFSQDLCKFTQLYMHKPELEFVSGSVTWSYQEVLFLCRLPLPRYNPCTHPTPAWAQLQSPIPTPPPRSVFCQIDLTAFWIIHLGGQSCYKRKVSCLRTQHNGLIIKLTNLVWSQRNHYAATLLCWIWLQSFVLVNVNLVVYSRNQECQKLPNQALHIGAL